MIAKLDEINRVLIVADKLGAKTIAMPIELVVEQCKATVIEGRMPEHEETISFCERLGLMSRAGEEVSVTPSGDTLLSFNPDRIYDLSDEQKKVVIRTCYLDGPLRQETHRLLRGFAPDYSAGTFRWSEIDDAPLDGEPWLADHLRQLGIVNASAGVLSVTPEYSKTIAAFLEEPKGWSEDDFREYLREKQEVGDIAEELVIAFEVSRLEELGCAVEARCVRRISRLRVNAGYDIDSYDGAAIDVNYDRFIEVKGARTPKLTFFWSENEMQVARKLGPRYWIYFQGGIDVATRTATNKPVMLQNPIDTVLPDESFKKIPHGVIVTSPLRGEVVSNKAPAQHPT